MSAFLLNTNAKKPTCYLKQKWRDSNWSQNQGVNSSPSFRVAWNSPFLHRSALGASPDIIPDQRCCDCRSHPRTPGAPLGFSVLDHEHHMILSQPPASPWYFKFPSPPSVPASSHPFLTSPNSYHSRTPPTPAEFHIYCLFSPLLINQSNMLKV